MPPLPSFPQALWILTPSSLPPGHTASAQAHTSISHITISSLACKLFFLCTSSNLPSKCPPRCKVIFSKATLMLSVRGLVTISVHSLQDQIHTSQTPLNHLQTQRSRHAAPGPLHSLCILPGTMTLRAASSFGSPPSLLKRHLLCGKGFA